MRLTTLLKQHPVFAAGATFPRLGDHPTVRHLRLSQGYVTTRVQLQAKDKLTLLQGIQFSVHGTRQKGRGLALPFNKFPSLCLTTWSVLFCSALALHSGCGNLEGKSRNSLADFISKPGPGGLPPTPILSGKPRGASGLLYVPGWIDIHTPAHISTIGYKGE